jgi:hypothetical protein
MEQQPQLQQQPMQLQQLQQQPMQQQQQQRTPSLRECVRMTWPFPRLVQPENKVRRAAALALLNEPQSRATASKLAQAVQQELGCKLAALGVTCGFRAVLLQDDIFALTDSSREDEPVFVLNTVNLQQRATSGMRATPLPLNSSSGSSSVMQSPQAAGRTLLQSSPRSAVAAAYGGSGTSTSCAVSSSHFDAAAALQAAALRLMPAGGLQSPQTPPPPSKQPPPQPCQQQPYQQQQRAGPSVSVGALLQFVSSRTWHESNPQLNVARRALAEHLVRQANASGDASRPACTDAAAYIITSPKAGACQLALAARLAAASSRY